MDDTSPHSTHSYHSQGSASFTLPMQAFNNPPVLPPAAAPFPLASTSSTFYAQPSTLPPLPLPASPPMSNYSFDPIGASAALNSMAVNRESFVAGAEAMAQLT